MGLFSKKPQIDPRELVELRREFTHLRDRLDVSERSKADVEMQLQLLDATTAALASRSHVINDVTLRLAEVEMLKPRIAQIDAVNAKIRSLDSLNGKLADLAVLVDASTVDAKLAREQTAAVQQRISNVSTELANQLGELSREIDRLATTQASVVQPIVSEQSVSDEVLEQLRSAQVRLANEQARYEIAFRQDLAMVADQVKRARHDR